MTIHPFFFYWFMFNDLSKIQDKDFIRFSNYTNINMALTESPSLQPVPRIMALVGPFQRFARKVVTGGFLLFASTILALLWANLYHESYHTFWHAELSIHIGPYHVSRSLVHWIDELLMTLFFFTVGLEIKRELLIGELA